MSYPGASRYDIAVCRGCHLHFDPDWLVDGLCESCQVEADRWNELAERD